MLMVVALFHEVGFVMLAIWKIIVEELLYFGLISWWHRIIFHQKLCYGPVFGQPSAVFTH